MMKKASILAMSVAMAVGTGSVTAGVTSGIDGFIYCVDDEGLNTSQFCFVDDTDELNPVIRPYGPAYAQCDIEALDITLEVVEVADEFDYSNPPSLYAAAGDDTPRPGHLYLVGKNAAALTDLGKINTSARPEIDAISFRGDELWGWDQHRGLFTISPAELARVREGGTLVNDQVCDRNGAEDEIIAADVVYEESEWEVEAITWNWEGDILYFTENGHEDEVDSHGESENTYWHSAYDYDFEFHANHGIGLWAYNPVTGVPYEICGNLADDIAFRLGGIPAEIESIEALAEGALKRLDGSPMADDDEDLLLLGFHGPMETVFIVVATPELPNNKNVPFTPNCNVKWDGGTDNHNSLNDIEGLAYTQVHLNNPQPENVPPFEH